MEDLAEIRRRVEIINDELGNTMQSVAKIEGQLIWIRWLLTALLGAIIGTYFL